MNPEGKVRHTFGSSGLKPGKNLTQLLAEARNEALEEAANAVKERLFFKSCTCSFEAERAIRELKGKR